MARAPSQKEIAAFIVGHGITDFVTGGKLSLIERNALWKVLKKLGPPAVSTTGRIAGTMAMGAIRAAPAIARTAKFITMRHPYIAAAVVTYEVVKNREQIEELAREGWEVIEPLREALSEVGPPPRPGIRQPAFMEQFRPSPRKSKYSRAMSAAMKAVKASPKGGGRGKISPAKTVFKTVSKAVSKVNRGLKIPSIGIAGIAARAAKKILGKRKKTRKGR